MARELTKGERYTFQKINGSTAVITDSTDGAEKSNNYIRSNVLIVSGAQSSILRISTHTVTNDPLLRFTINNDSYTIGMDNSENNDFKISRVSGLPVLGSTQTVLRVPNDGLGNVHIRNNFRVTGSSIFVGASTFTGAVQSTGSFSSRDFILMRTPSTVFPGVGNTSTGLNIEGTSTGVTAFISRATVRPLYLNRNNDGNLIEFAESGTVEGNINVSGTTVALSGAHLSRWSQLPAGQQRIDIPRGTILSNIDEMCDWNGEINEQLNRMKISDIEGDPNIAGVFQSWDDDDDVYVNDFYCAMTGDFIIRISNGISVQRGDLLISAGDGTAKPQLDDIIRSKTIAKVTSTHIVCTYNDGSYCVPCVLMAC